MRIMSVPSEPFEALRKYVPPLLLFGGPLLFYLARLQVPSAYRYDEPYHAHPAAQYVAGNPDAFVWSTPAPGPGVGYTWNHPRLACSSSLPASPSRVINQRDWRVFSPLFGAIGIVVATCWDAERWSYGVRTAPAQTESRFGLDFGSMSFGAARLVVAPSLARLAQSLPQVSPAVESCRASARSPPAGGETKFPVVCVLPGADADGRRHGVSRPPP